MQTSSPFDPTEFNFVLLQDFRIPGGVSVYEFRSHPIVDGKKDFLRLNLYLTKDGPYVTIWNGLLETLFTEGEFKHGRMASVAIPDDFDFAGYNEELFKGYIDSREIAGHIFKALRIGEGHTRFAPSALTAGPDGELRCELIAEAD